jgi:hypothetical protein
LWVYLCLFLVAAALTTVGILQSCPTVSDGHLVVGCDNTFVASSVWGHVVNWVLISTFVTAAGLATAFIGGRRPTLASFFVWESSGLLEIAVAASWFITPSFLIAPLLVTSAAAVLVSIPTGVACAGPVDEPKHRSVPTEA